MSTLMNPSILLIIGILQKIDEYSFPVVTHPPQRVTELSRKITYSVGDHYIYMFHNPKRALSLHYIVTNTPNIWCKRSFMTCCLNFTDRLQMFPGKFLSFFCEE